MPRLNMPFSAIVAFVGFSVVIPSAARAAPGWTASSTISEIISAEDGIILILASGSNPMGCGTPTWYRLRTSVSNYQATAATAVSAKAQGKSVQFWASSCDADGSSSIVAVWVKN